MKPELQDHVADLLERLQAAFRDSKVPQLALVAKARAVVRYANAKPQEFTAEDQLLLDDLHGLAKWGELVHPLARLEPAMFAAQRREKRSGPAPAPMVSRPPWGD